MSNTTFGIIKPDAVRGGKTGAIIQKILDNGFQIRGLKLIHMSRKEAEGFYAVHRERPFFAGLTEFMSSAPCVVMALERKVPLKHGEILWARQILLRLMKELCGKSLAVQSARMPFTDPTQTKTLQLKSHISLAS